MQRAEDRTFMWVGYLNVRTPPANNKEYRVNDDAQRQALDQLRARVQHNGNDPQGPIRETLARLGDRWSPLLLLILRHGMLRFTELQREVNAMADSELSQRILTLKLRALERDGMLQRTVIATIPPQVEYRLTPLGMELVARLEGLVGWLEQQAPTIEAARVAYDQA